MPIRYPEAFEEDGMESARRIPCPRANMRVRGLAGNCWNSYRESSEAVSMVGRAIIDMPDRWVILPAHRRRFGMGNPVACAAREREHQSDLPVLWRFPIVLPLLRGSSYPSRR